MHLQTKKVVRSYDYLHSVFLGSFAFVFLNFSLPIRADDLGIDAVTIGGMYAVFAGTMLLVRPIVGIGLDRFGRRRFFITAFLFYIPAMLVFLNSHTIYDFYLARFLQGVGAALMWVSAKTMTADLNKSQSVGEAMGKLTTTSVRGSMIGATYGFTLLGFMPMQSAWIWAFSGYAFASFIALTLSFFITETQAKEQVNKSQSRTVSSLTWSPNLIKVLILVFLSSFATALIEPIYLLYLKNKFDINVIVLAFVFLPAGLVHAVLPRYSGQWSDKFGRGPVIATGLTFAGCLSIALPMWNSLLLVALSYFLFAIGWAMAAPAEDALVADVTHINQLGTTMGVRESAGGMGAALGPLAGGYIYEYWAKEMAFVTNGILLLFVAVLALLWFTRKISRSHF